MTLQQLKYIVAIDRYRSFAKAADALGISQPTLSAMLVKLEDELDVRIFERSNKSVTPTIAGEKIIRQAERTIAEAERINELVSEDKGDVAGDLRLCVVSSIAPYILPKFIRFYTEDYPQVRLSIIELKGDAIQAELQQGHIDGAIATGGHAHPGILEIPLYTERFMVYLSADCWRKLPVFRPENLEHEKMWIMRDAQCLRDSAFSFCKARTKGRRVYEAGSIDTLIRIVDENGGFTIIPEMHLPFLSDAQRENVRRIEGDYLSQRRVSLYIREDYIRQAMLNTITKTLLRFMPEGMMEERIAKYGIRL
ncbi:LysR family transcriptional regulator, hydrogen peroxide-inducible genes activator [Xylanibacter ruminicola]|jgi:LysR family hydrogen peroxide-inducible transcriptional activator|uniref:LysR family transcriptional regulator, hydrogen peroxide-inducible genes activator n=1 Tax=Xylanibacter ruminicola TaxID=839 RepID=A0A1M7GE21_XYLRU|nr:LysR substrate-binding domain-containing protein [Xylanibacter ruminicola]SFC09210.1 LysR family transcriptional regulator, hydrogen peroxide-inducible genes activator [Xylanibacter ruminicola]SHM14520.1 LysR family transcriptional regulator, hydrogen peroxide-inducible genes activator [Xylanibacter ruminicola]